MLLKRVNVGRSGAWRRGKEGGARFAVIGVLLAVTSCAADSPEGDPAPLDAVELLDAVEASDTAVLADAVEASDTLVPADAAEVPDTAVLPDVVEVRDTVVPPDALDVSDTVVPADAVEVSDTAVLPDAAEVSDLADLPVATDLPDAFETPDPTPPETAIRFLHISDSHMYGTAEHPLTEPLQRAVQALNALPGEADFVIATGDYVDFLPDGIRPGDPSTFTATLATLKGLRWPVVTMAGNHEYYRSEMLDPTGEKAERDEYLRHAMGHDLDQSFDIRGVRFVTMSTTQGESWDASNGLAANFSDAQMAWLRQQLSGGLPVVMFLHHPPTTESLTTAGDSLCKALADHPGVVKAFFGGHLHGFWRGEACGTPYWLVGNTDADKPFYFIVDVEAGTGAVTVVNEAEVPFGTMPTFTCDPAAVDPPDPLTLAETQQVMAVGHLVTNLPGLEGAEGDGLNKVPLIVRMDAWDPVGHVMSARLSQALPDGDFLGVLPGAPCIAMAFDVEGPCAVGREVAFDLDLLPLLRAMLDVTPDPSWRARLEVRSFRLEGVVTASDGTPRLESGLMHLSASGLKALDDLKGILVSEYCGGRIPDCVPGESELPTCPTDAGAGFFDEVPEECDVSVGTYSLRLVLALLSAYPLENVAMVGAFATEPRPASASPQPGALDEAIFSTSPGGNCAPPVAP